MFMQRSQPQRLNDACKKSVNTRRRTLIRQLKVYCQTGRHPRGSQTLSICLIGADNGERIANTRIKSCDPCITQSGYVGEDSLSPSRNHQMQRKSQALMLVAWTLTTDGRNSQKLSGVSKTQSSKIRTTTLQWFYGFKIVTSSPLYSQGNGEAERAVKTIKGLLRKSGDPYLSLFAYQSTPLENGHSLAQLLMSRNVQIPCQSRGSRGVRKWQTPWK